MDTKAGLHPRLRSFLSQACGEADQLIDPHDPGPSRRALERELAELDIEPPDLWRISDTRLDTGRRVRVYEPQPGTRRLALVFFHGGGYVRCSIDTRDSICRLLSLKSGVVVVSVDYRPAPEAKFPEPLEDCHGVTVEIIEHAGMLHGFLLLRRIVGDEVERAFSGYGRALARALAVDSP